MTSTGHCHPRVVEAVRSQAEQLLHYSASDFYLPIYAETAKAIADIAPMRGPLRTYLGNSGTEMVEAAMTESWEVVSKHIERVDTIYRRIVADGVARGEFTVDDVEVATRCAHIALVRFCHPGLIVQCANQPGPTLSQMIDFVLAGLGHRPTAPARRRR